MTVRNKILVFSLFCFMLVGCGLQLTESRFSEHSSYVKYESKFKVKNKEGLELGEERIPRIKKQFYHVRLNDSTIMDLKWVSKRPIVGNRYKSYIDSTLKVEYLAGLEIINDSLLGTYRYAKMNYEPSENAVKRSDSTGNRVLDVLGDSGPLGRFNRVPKRKIEILENGKCYYSDYVPGGPDSGGGRLLKFYGNILVENDTITAILYRDALYKTPRKPFEIKLVKNINNDTLQSVIDGEISSEYGYVKIK